MFEQGQARLFGLEDKCPIRSYKQVALASVQEGGQVVEVDFLLVPRQDLACNTHTFKYYIS
jgi:hypothetical protein